jgi:hypothetical protein
MAKDRAKELAAEALKDRGRALVKFEQGET